MNLLRAESLLSPSASWNCSYNLKTILPVSAVTFQWIQREREFRPSRIWISTTGMRKFFSSLGTPCRQPVSQLVDQAQPSRPVRRYVYRIRTDADLKALLPHCLRLKPIRKADGSYRCHQPFITSQYNLFSDATHTNFVSINLLFNPAVYLLTSFLLGALLSAFFSSFRSNSNHTAEFVWEARWEIFEHLAIVFVQLQKMLTRYTRVDISV